MKNYSTKAMKKIRKIFKESGLTHQALGEEMGYSGYSARQSAWQFLKSKDPSFNLVMRFLEAMDTDVEELL